VSRKGRLDYFNISEGTTAYCSIVPAPKKSPINFLYECWKVGKSGEREDLGKFAEIRDLNAKSLSMALGVSNDMPIIAFEVASGKGCRVFPRGAFKSRGDLVRCRYDI